MKATLQDLSANDLNIIDDLILSGASKIAYALFPTGKCEIFNANEYIGSDTGYFDQADVTIFNADVFNE